MDYDRDLSVAASQMRYDEIRARREERRQLRRVYDEPLHHDDDDSLFGDRPKGSFAKVMMIQAIVCTVLVGLLLFARAVMPNTYRQLSTAYGETMETDMSAAEVWAAAMSIFGSVREEMYVVAPYREQPEEEEEPAEADASLPAEEEPAEEEPAEEVLEGIALEAPAAGGADIVLPVRDYSFAPIRTTIGPVVPVLGEMTSGFGYRVHPVTGEFGMHTGIDIAADEGTPIVAAFHGRVDRLGYCTRAGNWIVLAHGGGMETMYSHASEILAEEDMVIRAGEAIALVGSTGSSTGPHLHFEVRIDGVRVDAEQLFYPRLVVRECV